MILFYWTNLSAYIKMIGAYCCVRVKAAFQTIWPDMSVVISIAQDSISVGSQLQQTVLCPSCISVSLYLLHVFSFINVFRVSLLVSLNKDNSISTHMVDSKNIAITNPAVESKDKTVPNKVVDTAEGNVDMPSAESVVDTEDVGQAYTAVGALAIHWTTGQLEQVVVYIDARYCFIWTDQY